MFKRIVKGMRRSGDISLEVWNSKKSEQRIAAEKKNKARAIIAKIAIGKT